MNLSIFGNTAITIFALIAAPAAHATTVTFDALPDYGTAIDDYINTGGFTPYVENGVTVTPTDGLLAWYSAPGFAHMDDSGTDFASGLLFNMATAFDAVSFSLISLGYNFFGEHGPLGETINVTGFAGGSAIAFADFMMSGDYLDSQSFTLGSGFSALDALLIEIVYPANAPYCDAPCGHFDLDSVVLAPIVPAVPLPSSMAMLGAAGLALFGLRKRRRRISA
ncbi:MAG: PEP-CTERM sorting domain-containing protein [Rhodobacteraceae bacterium]|nr:PEP-CTERM sorting domain-containing protein [Paracoccaceae bacterium]MCP5342084.1 PEP-CTERM sorting domain-containing protein [Paracoccaceae bacterium]